MTIPFSAIEAACTKLGDVFDQIMNEREAGPIDVEKQDVILRTAVGAGLALVQSIAESLHRIADAQEQLVKLETTVITTYGAAGE